VKNDSVLIMMTTYNGEEFIREQLESIRFQTIPAWKL
jgi:putative glycosyltransferase